MNGMDSGDSSQGQASSSGGLLSRVNWAEFWIMVGMLVGIVLLWSTQYVQPLKILVIFFHEISQGLAALVTGGSVIEFALHAEEGGQCVTLGGNEIAIACSGYLGSMVWGAAILILASRTKYDRAILAGLGALLLGVALNYARPIGSFGFIFGAAGGGGMVAVALFLFGRVSDIILRVIGLTSCLYAVLDIKSDILDRPDLASDASRLAEHTGMSVYTWGIIWIVIAIAGAVGALVVASKGETRAPRED